MALNAFQAATAAYKQAGNMRSAALQNIKNFGLRSIGQATAPDRPDFISFVKTGVAQATEGIKSGEKVGLKSLVNRTTMQDLVASTTKMEMTVKTIVPIRDKILEAYKQVMNMAL